jgi:hypothetical protein
MRTLLDFSGITVTRLLYRTCAWCAADAGGVDEPLWRNSFLGRAMARTTTRP